MYLHDLVLLNNGFSFAECPYKAKGVAHALDIAFDSDLLLWVHSNSLEI